MNGQQPGAAEFLFRGLQDGMLTVQSATGAARRYERM